MSALAALRTWPERFYDALAFLSRLAPPRPRPAASLAACVAFFAPVGLLLGLFCTLPALALLYLGQRASVESGAAAALCPALAAWLWLALEVWATRGLHWDGLADLGDAAGSGATGERFWAVLRDSRLGAFGALHLLLACSGQWLGLSWHLAAGNWLVAILAPCWARAGAVWLAASVAPYEARSLGGMVCAGASPQLARGYVLLGLGMVVLLVTAGDCPLWRAPLLALGQFALLRHLARQARQHGGLSGDFLGACIEWSQLCFLLATL